jgi:hypothetical protein
MSVSDVPRAIPPSIADVPIIAPDLLGVLACAPHESGYQTLPMKSFAQYDITGFR